MSSLTYDDVFERVTMLSEIATLSHSLPGILRVARDPEGEASDLATLIGKDPALSMKMLRTANSSFYAFGRTIDTIEDAVVLLGFAEVERLSLAISVVNQFRGGAGGAQALRQLWIHSLVCAIAAETVVEVYNVGVSEAADLYSGALLHDIGKAALRQALPEAALEIQRLMDEKQATEYQAEHEVLSGATHCVVGAWAAGQWALPLPIVEAIRMHHTPEEAEGDDTLIRVVRVADALCYRFGVPAARTAGGVVEAHAKACESLPDKETLFERFRERYEEKREALEALAS